MKTYRKQKVSLTTSWQQSECNRMITIDLASGSSTRVLLNGIDTLIGRYFEVRGVRL